ncbi:MAG: shikimate dehydrogenase [Micavibrio sp.]
MMTAKAALIGFPVEHSLSPLIHGEWLSRYKIDGQYKAIAVMPENLQQWVATLASTGYAGFNVTLPHKSAVMEFCDTLDPLAEAIGAVNMVSVDASGKLHGTNTDVFGFLENLRDQKPSWNPVAGPVLVLGAGGAARAVIYALLEIGVGQITLCNRNRDRAFALAQDPLSQGKVNIIDWADREKALHAATLLVNTTSLGMAGQPPLEIDLAPVHEGCLVYDIVYRPLMTPLLQAAQARGLPIVTGLGMLLHQARPAFEKWFGVLPEIDAALVRKIEKAASA